MSSGKGEKNVGLGTRRERNEGKERGKEKRERGPGLGKSLGQAQLKEKGKRENRKWILRLGSKWALVRERRRERTGNGLLGLVLEFFPSFYLAPMLLVDPNPLVVQFLFVFSKPFIYSSNSYKTNKNHIKLLN